MFMILCSDALARLKERIKQQKEQASRLSPTDSVQGKAVTEFVYLNIGKSVVKHCSYW